MAPGSSLFELLQRCVAETVTRSISVWLACRSCRSEVGAPGERWAIQRLALREPSGRASDAGVQRCALSPADLPHL